MKKKLLDDERIYLAHTRYGYTFREIGDFLGVHYSTVSKALKRKRGGKQAEVNDNSKIKT